MERVGSISVVRTNPKKGKTMYTDINFIGVITADEIAHVNGSKRKVLDLFAVKIAALNSAGKEYINKNPELKNDTVTN